MVIDEQQVGQVLKVLDDLHKGSLTAMLQDTLRGT
jgi:hypothetical protein